jgi:hypothetical protein
LRARRKAKAFLFLPKSTVPNQAPAGLKMGRKFNFEEKSVLARSNNFWNEMINASAKSRVFLPSTIESAKFGNIFRLVNAKLIGSNYFQ